jgi:hypothetical protein
VRSGLPIMGTILAIAVISGCRSSSPDVSRVARAIASADSAAHQPLPPYRTQIGLKDLPVAASADSDSVAWVNINQKYVMPKRGPHLIDGGTVPIPPHYNEARGR